MECRACGKKGHLKKVCRNGRSKGPKNAALENLEGHSDNELANFAFSAFTTEP